MDLCFAKIHQDNSQKNQDNTHPLNCTHTFVDQHKGYRYGHRYFHRGYDCAESHTDERHTTRK